MKQLSLSVRALVSALLPTGIVAVLLAAVFLFGRATDIEDAHEKGALAIGQQLAASAEFALYTDNRRALAALADTTLRAPDVYAVTLYNLQGYPLVTVGRPSNGTDELTVTTEIRRAKLPNGNLRLILPIMETHVVFDNLHLPTTMPLQQSALGYVAIEFSKAGLSSRLKNLLLAGALITLGGLLLGAGLAMQLSRKMTAPIQHIADVVKEIGQGNFLARVDLANTTSTQALAEGVNRMAEQIRSAQQNLEKRIAEATDELRSKKEEAELATRAKSRFLASASHDLRQPIHALGMFVARLRQLPHDTETDELLGHVEESVQAMQGLLSALLDISRLDAGSMKPDAQPYPLAELLRRLAVDLSARADERGLGLRLRPSPLWVMSDPELLYRILLNITANALEYTERGGVLVGCRRRGKRVSIEIWDTGIGIPDEFRQAIFEEFVQLDNPARDRNKGLGLGLAIVDRTARLLGHPLYMRSRPTRGTCFAIEVPVVAARLRVGRRKTVRDAAAARLDGVVALVIDDDALSREAMAALLTSWGCIVHVGEGDDCLVAAATAKPPDVIVCDFRLPGECNGIVLIARLRQLLGRNVPACLVSGDTDPELMIAAAAADLPLLHKPVRPGRLRALLQRLIRLHEPTK